ncbi:hypothetical protein COO60DRAFT_354989 [Scenedesmus sp. NREL 46B-D3]|nr:hypothetical protein COO60DRAFT_354989 [Scenedesmus sp. NREL 46B-D3]
MGNMMLMSALVVSAEAWAVLPQITWCLRFIRCTDAWRCLPCSLQCHSLKLWSSQYRLCRRGCRAARAVLFLTSCRAFSAHGAEAHVEQSSAQQQHSAATSTLHAHALHALLVLIQLKHMTACLRQAVQIVTYYGSMALKAHRIINCV